MTNWWDELEPETETEKRLQAEVERLRAVISHLMVTLDMAEDYLVTITHDPDHLVLQRIRAALTNARRETGQQVLPGLE